MNRQATKPGGEAEESDDKASLITSRVGREHRAEFGFDPEEVDRIDATDGRAFVCDLLAGITVAIVALPLAIGFAIASGMTPAQGLWTAIVGGFLISFFGGSRVQIGGPTGAFVPIIAGIVAAQGHGGLAVATLLAGVMLIVMGALRLGARDQKVFRLWCCVIAVALFFLLILARRLLSISSRTIRCLERVCFVSELRFL